MTETAASFESPAAVPAPPPRIYGARARLALLVPSTNTVAEIEFWRLAPEGVSIHTARMPFFADRHEQPFDEMERHVPRVLEEVNSAAPDVIAYGCTASSAKGDPRDHEIRLSEQAGRPVVTAAGALVAALAALGADRVVLVTPYPPAVNDKERGFFAGNGITVLEDESVIVDPRQHRFQYMHRVPADRLAERAGLLAGRTGADAIVLSCCDMPTLAAIPQIETATGRPVVTSTQALFWRAARTAGIDTPTPGAGQLLARH